MTEHQRRYVLIANSATYLMLLAACGVRKRTFHDSVARDLHASDVALLWLDR